MNFDEFWKQTLTKYPSLTTTAKIKVTPVVIESLCLASFKEGKLSGIDFTKHHHGNNPMNEIIDTFFNGRPAR